MNVGLVGIGLFGILGVMAVVVVVTIAATSARKNAARSRAGLIATIFGGAFAAALLAALLLVPTQVARTHSHASATNVNADAMQQSNGIVEAPSDSSAAGQSGRHVHVGNDSPRTRVESRILYGDNDRPRFGRMLLMALSLAALLVLARVAVDGRRGSGFGAGARIVAVLAFAGICALLANLGPILR
ncbi:MAG: hypothetical protein H6818_01930 [Phycisphaerales bacterium]|nr:hypothetical protein [Phycisphaerales bacterium]